MTVTTNTNTTTSTDIGTNIHLSACCIKQKEASVLVKIYFADLTSARLYAALTSFVWALVVSISGGPWYTLNWNFMYPPISQQHFALILVLLSITQLFLINSAASRLARILDTVVYGAYLSFWGFAAFCTAFFLDQFDQALIANHILLASLGFWIFSRGFSSLKT